MADMIYRQWLILQKLSTRQGLTLTEIEDYLQQENIHCHRRTLQRDMDDLSACFPIIADEQSKPYRWKWMPDAPRLEIPSMTPEIALTFVMTENMLARALPATVTELLQPYFDTAKKVLGSLNTPLKNWNQKIATISTRLPMLAPQIDPDAMKVVYDALLKEKRFVCQYDKGQKQLEEYQINPLGLIFADNVIYLVATFWEYSDLRQLALHRIKKATLLDQPRSENAPEFDLGSYIADGHFFFKKQGKEKLQLTLKIDNCMLRILQETPLSQDQKIIRKDNYFLLHASVPDNAQIKWWILSLGENITVLEPASLRQKIIKTLAGMQQNYM